MQSPLRNVRKAHGFTLQHVAAGVQVNPATLSRIERLEQIPSIELAERLANFFKGEVSEMQILYSRLRVLQSASKLRQSGRVAHRCEGDTRRHFPRLTERAQEPEPQPVRETRPVRNFYVGTNDPRVILCLTRQAEELESRGLYRRAATVWMAAFRESHSQPERNNFLARREQCLQKSSKRAASGEEWYLSGNYVGA
ncbi:TPA: helix-turn-helix domain-containing protein [Escherichia coli]